MTGTCSCHPLLLEPDTRTVHINTCVLGSLLLRLGELGWACEHRMRIGVEAQLCSTAEGRHTTLDAMVAALKRKAVKGQDSQGARQYGKPKKQKKAKA